MLAMLAFAGNSLLCRAALRDGDIDPASFTAVRLAAGATVLLLILSLPGKCREASGKSSGHNGSWPAATALFVYAAAFSFAYVALDAGTGAVTSGLGYVLWYIAVRALTSLEAALVQLSVPAVAAAGGVLLLSEPLTLRMTAAGVLILGGILLALRHKAAAAG